jgi:probable addiction module antidote protein
MTTDDTHYLLDSLDGIEGLTDFDAADSLTSPEAIAAYVNDVISSGNADLMKEALKSVLKAKGFAKVAEQSGLTREGVYKALRPSSKPQWDTIRSLLLALGLEIRVVPAGSGNGSVLAA